MKATFFKLDSGLYINVNLVETWEEKAFEEAGGYFEACPPFIELRLASGWKVELDGADREAWLCVVLASTPPAR